MFTQHHLVSALRVCNGGLLRPSVRSISTSLPRRATEVPTSEAAVPPDEDFDALPAVSAEEGSEAPKAYRDFMNKIGYQYRLAEPRNWLGGDVPFPMNPSFRPPPPISNEQRDVIWALYEKDPIKNSVRRLAKRFNLSHRRLDAILRLKGMEQDWTKGKELQTGFQKGMDRVLQAETHSATPKLSAMLRNEVYQELQRSDFSPPDINPERADVHKADMLDEQERRDLARDRYQRLYWEAIPESANEPVLPSIIQHLKIQAELKSKAEADKKKVQFMKPVPDTQFIRRPSRSSILKTGNGSAPTMFVDVGAEFMDVRDINRRATISRRKATMRARRAVKKRFSSTSE